jgi:hypothetical protein
VGSCHDREGKGRSHRNRGRIQVGAPRFSTDAVGLLDGPERPAKPSYGNNLLFLLVAQDTGHIG